MFHLSVVANFILVRSSLLVVLHFTDLNWTLTPVTSNAILILLTLFNSCERNKKAIVKVFGMLTQAKLTWLNTTDLFQPYTQSASHKMCNKAFERLPTKCCTAVGTDWRRLGIVNNYTNVIFMSEQSRWEFFRQTAHQADFQAPNKDLNGSLVD